MTKTNNIKPILLTVVTGVIGTLLATTIINFISFDPRKELSNLGIQWSVENFLEAVRQGDTKTVNLFLKGGMHPHTMSVNTTLASELAKNINNPEEVLGVLKSNGLDINHHFNINDISHPDFTVTLVKQAIFAKNLKLLQALIHSNANLTDEIDAFGPYFTTYKTTPLQYAETLAKKNSAYEPMVTEIKKALNSQ